MSEELIYSDWTKKREPVKSQYVKGLMVDGGEDFRCPRCHWTVIQGLENGQEYVCVCKLKMVRWINLLELLGDES